MGVAAAVGVSACGDDDSMTTATAPPATASTVAESPTRTAVPTITPAPATARPTPSASQTAPAEPLARSPGYFLYRSQPGDTLLRLGGYFNGQPGTAKAGFPDQIRDINKLTTSDIPSGTDLFIPLIRTGDDIIPGAGIALAIQRLQPSNASPILFTPGQALRDRLEGFIALHRVELTATGYQLDFWLTDRPPMTASGSTDPSAAVTGLAFKIAAGSFVDALPPDSVTVARFERDGVQYGVATVNKATISAADVVQGLGPARVGP